MPTGAQQYIYDEAGHLLGEYDANGSMVQETVWLGDLPVAVLKQTVSGTGDAAVTSTQVYYVYADQINTPRVIVQATDNQMVWRWDMTDPFGLQQPNENPAGVGGFTYNPRFPGQLYDRETNLHYNMFRDYDPQQGRYVESDPIGLAGGLNIYRYVGGNPISLSDPRGLQAMSPGIFIPENTFPKPRPIKIVHGTPANACTCSYGGKDFSAPPGANYIDVYGAGQNGVYNPFTADSNIGHFGTYDYQRNSSNNTFTGAYTNASNFSVGVYMRGAGFSRDETVAIGSAFALTMSKNAGATAMADYWNAGWDAANSGNLVGICK